MADQGVLELHKQHREGQSKYTYFLLAVAASAVAFAVQKTTAMKMSWSMLPLGLAAISWGLSFYCGCKNLLWVQTAIFANYSLLQLKSGIHPDQPPHPQLLQAAEEGVRAAIETNIKGAEFNGKWQFRLLIIGSILFLTWHVLDMALRTLNT